MPKITENRPLSNSRLVSWDFNQNKIVEKKPDRGRFSKLLDLRKLVSKNEFESRLRQSAHDAILTAFGSKEDDPRWQTSKPLLEGLFADKTLPINEVTVGEIVDSVKRSKQLVKGGTTRSTSGKYFSKAEGAIPVENLGGKMTKLEDRLVKLSLKSGSKAVPTKAQAAARKKASETSKQLDQLYVQKADFAASILTPKPPKAKK